MNAFTFPKVRITLKLSDVGLLKHSNNTSHNSELHMLNMLKVQRQRYQSEKQTNIQCGPKKVSHYRESSLNRIKKRQPG